MKRRPSLLVCLISLLVIGACTASGATAAKLVGSAGTVDVHGQQATTNEFVLTDNSNLKTTCGSATLSGYVPAGGTGIATFDPSFSECTAFGLNSTVNAFPCYYELLFGAFNAAGTPISLDLDCIGGAIVITTLTCELKIPEQTKLGSPITGTNKSGYVLLDLSITDLGYQVTKDGIGCPLSKTGSFAQADYVGTMTLTADEGTLKIE